MRNIIIMLAVILLLPFGAEANSLTKAADAMVREMDRQLVERLGRDEGPINNISLLITTPVDINNFENSNSLARQMQEHISCSFIQSGYNVQEIRKGKAVLMRQETGELLLTRNRDLLSQTNASSALTMVGTYSVTARNVTFNIRLVHTGGNDILAMSSLTVPINGEIRAMLGSGNMATANAYLIQPSVFSRLP